jgi:hypothetical protein
VEKETYKNVTSYFRTYARFMGARQVGVLVRNACELFDPQKPPASGRDSGRLSAVCTAYEQAGRDLATRGFIRRSTQRAANQEIVPIPFFRLLKHFRPVKKWVVEYARKQPK